MKLITYNVNGIRAATKKGLFEWVKEVDPDVMCFQETKAQPDQVDLAKLIDAGYHDYWFSAEKKGYSGVLTLSKQKAKQVSTGIGVDQHDSEGRVLQTDFGKWTLLNCYFPSGSSSEDRHAVKMQFLYDLRPWINKLLKKQKKIILVGDYNIVHQDIDIHNPTRKDKPSGFRPEEREWLDQWFKSDFKDAFRLIHPDITDEFSWWSYRAGSRPRNKGWRIDYISVSNPLAKKVKSSGHHHDAVHSDHCPVWVEIDI